ncbi:MAG TPA: hypothetical protein VGM87_01460 [Roseomonas sp.]|jgi:hypothetical protein
MPADAIDWIIITDVANREIGAIGFLDGRAAVVASFFEDRDGNLDGRVSWAEAIASLLSPVSLKNMAVTRVAMAARYDMRVLERDESFEQEAMRLYLHFAAGLVVDGVYATYFQRGVSAAAGGVAGRITSNAIKQFAIRKGMEAAVKHAYEAAVKP